jgi:hypothetical protein
MAAKPKQHKDRPVYLTVRTLVDQTTGEPVGGLVPHGWADQTILRERKYRNGDVIRATLVHPRNAKFHRLLHQLGSLVRQNVDGFEHLDSHAVIKRLQREAGVCCDIQTIDAAPVINEILNAAEPMLGEMATRMLRSVLPEIKTIEVLTPQSLAFDCMDESDFRILWSAICRHLVVRYWPQLNEQEVTRMAELMPHNEGA